MGLSRLYVQTSSAVVLILLILVPLHSMQAKRHLTQKAIFLPTPRPSHLPVPHREPPYPKSQGVRGCAHPLMLPLPKKQIKILKLPKYHHASAVTGPVRKKAHWSETHIKELRHVTQKRGALHPAPIILPTSHPRPSGHHRSGYPWHKQLPKFKSRPSHTQPPQHQHLAAKNPIAKHHKRHKMHTKSLSWAWPFHGRVIQRFSTANGGHHGIDISGPAKSPIHAAAAGKVVYVGSGLAGYGKLVIIKHNTLYLSAYALNEKILVKEKQLVHKGETIALMGRDDRGHVKLHFEIRRRGKPVNPLKGYL